MASDTEINVKISSDTKGLDDGLSNAKKKIKDSTEDIVVSLSGVGTAGKKAAEDINSSMGAADISLKDITSTILVATSKFAGFAAILGQIKSSIDISSTFESMQIGIAAVISGSSQNVTALGKSVNATQKFAISQGEANDAMVSLRKANLQTLATLSELGTAFQSTLASARSFGMTISETIVFTKNMANAAASMGMPMYQLSQELRAIFEGDTSRNSKVNQILQITPDIVTAHRAAGDLAKYLDKRLEDYAAAGEAMANSWKGISSNIQDAIELIKAKAAENIFASLKSGGLDLQKRLTDNTDQIAHSFSVAFEYIAVVAKGAYQAISSSIQVAWIAIKSLLESVLNVFGTTIAEIQQRGDLLNPFGTMALGLLTLIEGIKAFGNIVLEVVVHIGRLFHAMWEDVYGAYIKVINGMVSASEAMGIKSLSLIAAQKKGTEELNSLKADGLKFIAVENSLEKDRNNLVDRLINSYKTLKNIESPATKKKEQAKAEDSTIAKPLEKTPEEKKAAEKLAEEIRKINEKAEMERLAGIEREYQAIVNSHADGLRKYKDSIEGRRAVDRLYAAELEHLYKKANDDGIKEAEKANKEKAAIDAEDINRAKNIALQKLNIDASIEATKFQNLSMSMEENIAIEKQLENQRYKIKKDAAEKIKGLYKEGTIEYAKAGREQEDIALAHTQREKELNLRAARDSAEAWHHMSDSIKSAFTSSIAGLLNATSNWKTAFQSLLNGILGAFTQMIAQMIVKWGAGELAKSAIGKWWAAQEVITEGTKETAKTAIVLSHTTTRMGMMGTEVSTKAVLKQTEVVTEGVTETEKTTLATGGAMARIGLALSEAFAGIVAFYSFLGPAAVAAAAVTVAGAGAVVYGMVSSATKSASGGYDIPSGVNPVTQLHQDEMVLPAHIANPLRDSLAGGGVGGGTNITINALDAKSVAQLFKEHGGAIVDSLKNQNRNFKLV